MSPFYDRTDKGLLSGLPRSPAFMLPPELLLGEPGAIANEPRRSVGLY